MQNKNTQSQLSNGIQSLLNRVLLVFSVCLISSVHAASGTRITQEAYHQSSLYTETAADMTEQTASGSLTVHRYFRKGEWVFFPGWVDLAIATTLGADGQPADITFREADYQREYSSVVMYRFDEKNVIYKKDANTWRWRHTGGSWIDFNLSGRATASGKNDLTYFTITRNADGDITQIDDQRGQLAVRLTYHAAGKPKTLTDYAGRTVTYGYDAGGNLSTTVTDVLFYRPLLHPFYSERSNCFL